MKSCNPVTWHYSCLHLPLDKFLLSLQTVLTRFFFPCKPLFVAIAHYWVPTVWKGRTVYTIAIYKACILSNVYYWFLKVWNQPVIHLLSDCLPCVTLIGSSGFRVFADLWSCHHDRPTPVVEITEIWTPPRGIITGFHRSPSGQL